MHPFIHLSFFTFVLFFSIYGAEIHTNEFAVRIPGPPQSADTIANKYGFVNKGQIGSLEGYYLFEHHHVVKRSTEPSHFHMYLLQNDSMVLWCEQQVIKSRIKRSKVIDTSDFIDPLYPEQWFLNGGGYNGFDMNVLPAWKKGYTGKGVVVSILDDGIQGNHPDLAQNYDKSASWDINGSDDDPSPRDNDDNKHGTRCAGEVAAVANNEFCGVGVAYNASIGGVRMLDGSVTDCIEATALSLKPNHIDIYSASWGPEDDGKTVDGPGVLAIAAFEDGIKKGRKGLGSLFIWASGNGGNHSDNCNCDGYTNSIYTVSISSATQSGLKPWYLEECSSTLATTYSSGAAIRDNNIATVDVNYAYIEDLNRGTKPNSSHLCTRSHTGTSASAPIAAGLCALALQANCNLSWRDMQYIIVLTSRYTPLKKENGWITNGIGRKVSTKFGYGLMDGEAMVTVAENWKTLGPQHICSTVSDATERIIPSEHGEKVEATIYSDGCLNSENVVKYLEHVQVRITLTFHPRGNLHIILVSPSGTPSPVLLPRIHDRKDGDFKDWPFMSVHFWGENVTGTWKLIIINDGNLMSSAPGRLKKFSITFYGTVDLPSYLKTSIKSEKETEEKVVEYSHPVRGLSDSSEVSVMECKLNNKFLVALGNEPSYCSFKCPPGSYGSKKDSVCQRCDKSCSLCYGPSYNNCLECASKYFLLNSVCVKSCPEGYFANIRPNSRICIPCVSSCVACEGSMNRCVLCKKGLYSYKSQCLHFCPRGTYPSKNKCNDCSTKCESCFGPLNSDCLACSESYYLVNTTCSPDCPSNHVFNNENKCVKCHRSCASCSSPSECTACEKKYHNHHGSNACVFGACDNDPQCIVMVGSICDLSIDEGYCDVCNRHLFWKDGSCVEKCPSATYNYSDECNDCYAKCLSCEKDPYYCSACHSGFYLYLNSCLENCPPGYYGGTDGICKKCHSSCSECFGNSASQCMSCPRDKYLINDSCIDICPMGFYSESLDNFNECFPCHASCKECSAYGPYFCTRCFPGTYLIDNVCIPCLDGEYFHDVLKVCERCHDNCGACFGPSFNECKSCVPPLRLHKVLHKCLSCCDHKRKDNCCSCREALDICINQSSQSYNIATNMSDDEDNFSKHVIPITIGVSAIAIVLFVLLFGILQYRSSGLWRFGFGGKRYMPVPRESSAKYNNEQEKISLTQEDLEEEDEIFQKI